MTKIFGTNLQKRLAVAAVATALAFSFSLAAFAADPSAAQPAKPKPAQAAPSAQPAQPAKPQAAQPAKAQSQAQPAQQNQNIANPVTAVAIRGGVKTCADKIQLVTNFLTDNKPYAGNPMWFLPQSLPDSQLVSTSLELSNAQTNQLAYASASFASEGNDCNGMYEMVTYSPQSCQEVYKASFSSLKQLGTMYKGIPVLAGNGGLRVFLMQAGTGCVSIRKEVVW